VGHQPTPNLEEGTFLPGDVPELIGARTMSLATEYVPETFARRWLPADVPLKTWEQIEPWYRQVLDRPIDSPQELEDWLAAVGELNAAVGQEGVERYIAMTCQTDDPQREAAYLAFVREIEPHLKPLQNAIRSKYLDSPHRAALDRGRYLVFDRAQENRRSLYREANIPRETELAELDQQYQKTIGAMTVNFRGQERTPAQMAPFLEETDRSVRQEAWELVAHRRLADRERLDDLFDRMVRLRVEVAREAGLPSFVDYAFRLRERFDYGVADTLRFHEGIERVVVPLARELQEERRQALAIESLRPWDLAVDPLGRPPLRPFQDVEQLAAGAESIFAEVDPELGRQFAYLRAEGLLDLANRKGKAPGGYQTTLEDDRLPFIFMNAVGLDGDVRTVLHEGGHAFHALASRGEPLAAYRESPIEFCEVASMSMELLGARDLGLFYGKDDANRSYRQLLEGIVSILPWIATVDAFQHWIYAHPGHTREERRAAWNGLLDRFGGTVDWSGHEDARSNGWHRQLHIFLYPFYYIEYGIAQLGALQIWRRSLVDRPAAVKDYRKALAIGGARPLPELFSAAGAKFEFTEASLGPLMDAIGKELDLLAP
jgi:oligoendopeptidase F